MGHQTPRMPIAAVFVRGLIFYPPWVVLAPAITVLGWYQRLGTAALAWRVPVWIVAVVIACVVDPVIMTVLAPLLGVHSSSALPGASFLSEVRYRFTQSLALNIDITDSGQGAVNQNGRGAGRGLKNVRERLEARYESDNRSKPATFPVDAEVACSLRFN